MHFEWFHALLCAPALAFCIELTWSLWTGDALTLTPCSYCACKWFKITAFLFWVYWHTFPYVHLSDCNLITSNYIWMEGVELCERHKLTLILNCQGGKMGYLNLEKNFVVFCCAVFFLQSDNEPITIRFLHLPVGSDWINVAYISQHSGCPFVSIFHYFSAVLFLCHLSPPHISGSLFHSDPFILPFCSLADLIPALFWSSALGDANSPWLVAATHFLPCPRAVTVCMSQEESEGCGQANEERRDGEEDGQKRVSHGKWKSLQVISQ